MNPSPLTVYDYLVEIGQLPPPDTPTLPHEAYAPYNYPFEISDRPGDGVGSDAILYPQEFIAKGSPEALGHCSFIPLSSAREVGELANREGGEDNSVPARRATNEFFNSLSTLRAQPAQLSPAGLAWDHPYSPMPNPATGGLIVDPDIVLRAQKFDLEISFYYSSTASESSIWGMNRDASVSQGIAEFSSTITRGDFSQWGFSAVGTAGGITTYVSTTPGCPSTLTFNANNEFVEYFPDGSQQIFDRYEFLPNKFEWRLGQVIDPNGVIQTYSYINTDTGNIQSIQVPGNMLVTFSYSGGLVSNFEDWSGRTWTFQYDANNNLTTYMQPSGCITEFGYNSDLLLQTITDPRGYLTTYLYNSAGQITTVLQGSGTWSYTYSNTAGFTNGTCPESSGKF